MQGHLKCIDYIIRTEVGNIRVTHTHTPNEILVIIVVSYDSKYLCS